VEVKIDIPLDTVEVQIVIPLDTVEVQIAMLWTQIGVPLITAKLPLNN